MPISFGHPAATDEDRSFVVRFNANAPLMIRELETPPRMDSVLGNFLMAPKPSRHFSNTRQGQQCVLLKDSNYKVVQINCLGNQGGTVFVYLCALSGDSMYSPKPISIEATCRGMSCRVAKGLLDHETIAKGKKFQASWRKFSTTFVLGISSLKPQSRLLMVLYQSGQDTEIGKITCKPAGHILGNGQNDATPRTTCTTLDKYWNSTNELNVHNDTEYKDLGVFHPISMDSLSFQWCGADAKVGSKKSMDPELERAFALSCEDDLLQEALKRSQEDMGKISYVDNSDKDVSSNVVAVTKRDSNSATGRSAIDLTGTDVMPVSYESHNMNDNENKKSVMLFDLTAADRQNSVKKKADNVDSTNKNNTCIMIESSDEEDDKPNNSIEHDKMKQSNTKVSLDSEILAKSRVFENQEKKRKLAAEAARRRMKRCPECTLFKP